MANKRHTPAMKPNKLIKPEMHSPIYVFSNLFPAEVNYKITMSFFTTDPLQKKKNDIVWEGLIIGCRCRLFDWFEMSPLKPIRINKWYVGNEDRW